MDHLSLKQRDMIERCGWSKASASQIYNGTQDYSPKIVKEAARALNVRTYELLIHPDRALFLRKLEEAARTFADVAADSDEFPSH